MIAFIRRHPAASYFTLTFALSWGGIAAVVLPGAIPATPPDAERLFPWVYLAMLAGPAFAGPLIAMAVDGRNGLRDFRDRLMRRRVAPQWYAAALLTAPLALGVTLLLLSLSSSEFVPALLASHGLDAAGPVRGASRVSFLLMGLGVGLGAGVFEELGWTGLALPVLRSRYNVVVAALVLGVAWGIWHFFAVLWGSADAFGTAPVPVFMLAAMFTVLPPYRVLMALLYERTGSLLVAMLMHASLTSTLIVFGPQVTGYMSVSFNALLGAFLWAVVVALMRRRQGALAPIPARP